MAENLIKKEIFNEKINKKSEDYDIEDINDIDLSLNENEINKNKTDRINYKKNEKPKDIKDKNNKKDDIDLLIEENKNR